jgi:hypothetical protein
VEYPERPGQPLCEVIKLITELFFNRWSNYMVFFTVMWWELMLHNFFFLQYYAKNGTCKFGSNCKFDHPRESGFVLVALNSSGYPLRQVGVLIQSKFPFG